MEKKDLKTGMQVEFENGERRLILLDTEKGDVVSNVDATIDSFGRRRLTNYYGLNNWNDDLTKVIEHDPLTDIVKVYGMYGNIIWERKEVPEYVELLVDNYGYKNGDIAKVVEERSSSYVVFAPNRVSDSCFTPNVRYLTLYTKPSTKEAYDAQHKAKKMTIKEIQSELGYKIEIVE